MTRDLSDLIIEAAQILKQHNGKRYADVVQWMLAQEKDARKTRRAPQSVMANVARNGKRVRGGRAGMNLTNPDVTIEELD